MAVYIYFALHPLAQQHDDDIHTLVKISGNNNMISKALQNKKWNKSLKLYQPGLSDFCLNAHLLKQQSCHLNNFAQYYASFPPPAASKKLTVCWYYLNIWKKNIMSGSTDKAHRLLLAYVDGFNQHLLHLDVP